MHELWRRSALLVGTSVRVSPGRCAVALLEPIASMMYLLNAVWLGLLVDGMLTHDASQIVIALVGTAASIGIGELLSLIGATARLGLSEVVGFEFDRRIAELTAALPGIEHHERPDYLDELQILRDDRGALGGAVNFLLNFARNLVYAAATLVIAVLTDPRLLIVAVAALPALAGSRYRIRWTKAGEDESAEAGRLTRHLADLTTGQQSGMELRVFGLSGEIRRRLAEATLAWRRPRQSSQVKCAWLSFAETVVFVLMAGAVLLWLIHDAAAGAVSPGTVVVAVSIFQALQQAAVHSAWMASRAADTLRVAGRFLWLSDYSERVCRESYAGTAAPPQTLHEGIRLDRVGFAYAGVERPSLHGVSLLLPAGSVVALVGENGAGKSTLVKLLVGLYRPTGGRITVDGTDLTTLDIDAWREQGSAAFQDFAKLEFSVQHAVGVGRLDALDDADAVHTALSDAAAADVGGALPEGLETQLGTSWAGGVDLSGGQWQKLALGRALMRREPLLLVFDEPTSALDAPTEHALFQRYAAAARAGADRGAITLLVTHRFSTVRAADLILVLEHGRVTEYGTHDDLIAAAGHYAELYGLQAAGYR